MSAAKSMRRAVRLALLVAPLVVASTTFAAKPAACSPWKFFVKTSAAKSPACGCPDDYCPKPQPAPCADCRAVCNDYCPKPQPVVCPDDRGCCDDYRPKLWQPLSWCPPCVYRCVPGGCPAK